MRYFLLFKFCIIASFVVAQSDNCFSIKYNFENKVTIWPETSNQLHVFVNPKENTQHSFITCPTRGFKTVGSLEETVPGADNEMLSYFPLYDSLPYIMFKNYETKTIFHKEQEFGDRTGNEFIYTREDMTSNSWKIQDSTKMIDSIPCYLASIDFRCRTYYAWFAPSIPIFCVPFKLPKLPGLVLEMYSSDRELYYYMTSIKEVNCAKGAEFPMPPEFSDPKIWSWTKKKARCSKLVEKVEARFAGTNFTVKVIECFDD
jgi:GLPGLI family protein